MTETLIVFGDGTTGRKVIDAGAPPLKESVSLEATRAVGLVLGRDRSSILAMAGRSGFDEAIGLLLEKDDSPSTVAERITEVVRSRMPSVVLLPSDLWWDDIACRLAAALGVEPVLDCMRCEVNPEGHTTVTRLTWNSSALETRTDCMGVTVATLRLPRRKADMSEVRRPCEIVDWLHSLERCEKASLRVMAVSDGDALETAVADADVIVAGGRGVGSASGFETLAALAQVLGGTFAGSRIAVDRHWVGRDRQVGQTGSTVSPRLYIACGISGAPHHVLGMKDSETVIAVNTDPEAAIFRIADAGVIGDCNKYVSSLIDELRKRKHAEQ